MRQLGIILLLLLSILFNSCDKGEEVLIDYEQYSEDYNVSDFDSIFLLSEAGSGGRKTVFLNIHCTATREGSNLRGDWFLEFFKNDRKWSRPGYNEIVELDGNRFVAVPYNLDGLTSWDEVSFGVKGINSISINIAYVGGVDKFLKPKDTRTHAQIRAIDEIVYTIKCYVPDIIIMGHRDHRGVNKACPSFDVHSEYGDLNPVISETKEFDYNPDEYRVDSLR